MVGKHAGALLTLHCAAQELRKIVAIEDVVAQHQCAQVVADERLSDQERLRQAIGRRLHRILEVQPPALSGAQQLLKPGNILWRGNNQDFPDASQH
ncbi:hypothetical protein D3C72_2315570 [compost metagenome]